MTDYHAKCEHGRARRDCVECRTPRFCAWDGEAVDGEYVMILSSDGARLVNPNGIRTVDALEFLLDNSRPRTVHVGFVWSYDVNMILGDLPESFARKLWQTGRVVWRGYVLHYRDRREFSVREGARYVRIWDVFGFFQSSFVAAVQSWLDVPTDEIERMKAARPDFAMADLPQIEAYCRDEVVKLAQIMDRLWAAAKECQITLPRFDGAGAVAAALLRNHRTREFGNVPPEPVEFAGRAAYYGGRIELARFGNHSGQVWTYDLRSAYPWALTDAPCLTDTEWVYDDARGTVTFTNNALVWAPRHIRPDALYRIQWDLTGDVLPFPWRDSDGAVYFPNQGRGWLWGHEVLAGTYAVRRGVIGGLIEVLGAFLPSCRCNHAPFGWIPGLFAIRAEWKRQGRAAEKVLKLGLNSLYGKCAQRKGSKGGKPPSFHNILWASYTTSKVRARLYESSIPAIEAGKLIAYATDAIFTAGELPGLDVGPGLGQWESGVHDSGTFTQSGVYWLGSGDDVVEHTRGFQRGEFSRDTVLDCWKRGVWEIDTKVRRFRGIGTAIILKQGGWRTWSEAKRTLRLEPSGTKRSLKPGARLHGRGRIRPDKGLIQTIPADILEQVESNGLETTPLALPWIDGRGFQGSAYSTMDRADAEGDSGYE